MSQADLDHVLAAARVDVDEPLVIVRLDGNEARDVQHDGLRALRYGKERLERFDVREVSLHDLGFFGNELHGGVACEHEGAYPFPLLDQLPYDGAAQKPRGARDQINSFVHTHLLSLGASRLHSAV